MDRAKEKGKNKGRPKGKDIAKGGGKYSEGQKGWTATADDSESVYTIGADHVGNWGFAKEQERWGQEKYQTNWSWYPP